MRGLTNMEYEILSASNSAIDTYFPGAHEKCVELYEQGLLVPDRLTRNGLRWLITPRGQMALRLENAVRIGKVV